MHIRMSLSMSGGEYGGGRRTHNACLLTNGLSEALHEGGLGLQATLKASQAVWVNGGQDEEN